MIIRRTSIRRSVPLAIVAALAFTAACGGDDDAASTTVAAIEDSGADTAVGAEASGDDTLVGSFAEALLQQEVAANPEEAACAAMGIVTVIGEDRMTELGVTPGNIGDMSDYEFTDEEEATMMGEIFGCVDIASALRQDYVDSGLTEEQAVCVVDKIDVDALTELAASGPEGSEAAGAAQQEAEVAAFAECGVDG